MLNSFRSHSTDVMKARLSGNHMNLVMMPGSMTSVLQLLDVCLNKPFKAHMNQMYMEWMPEGLQDLIPTDQILRVKIALLCRWIVNTWKEISDHMVCKMFKKCCTRSCLDGTEDDDIWIIPILRSALQQ